MKDNKNIIILFLSSLVFCGLGFFSGMKYQEKKFANFRFQGQMNRQAGQGNIQFSFRPVAGEILSVDDKSITVKLEDGSSKIIILSQNTKISQTAEATQEELKTGVEVAVFGATNDDGSITAQNIELNPLRQGLPIDN